MGCHFAAELADFLPGCPQPITAAGAAALPHCGQGWHVRARCACISPELETALERSQKAVGLVAGGLLPFLRLRESSATDPPIIVTITIAITITNINIVHYLGNQDNRRGNNGGAHGSKLKDGVRIAIDCTCKAHRVGNGQL